MGYSSRSRSSLLRIGVSASVSLRKPKTKMGITNDRFTDSGQLAGQKRLRGKTLLQKFSKVSTTSEA